MELIGFNLNDKQIIATDISYNDYPSDIKLGCRNKEVVGAKTQSKTVPEYVGDWSITYLDDRLCAVCDRGYAPLSIQFATPSNIRLHVKGMERPLDIPVHKASVVVLTKSYVMILDEFREKACVVSDKQPRASYNLPGQ